MRYPALPGRDDVLVLPELRHGLPKRVLWERKGHCLEEERLLAVAALRVNGHPPLLMDLEAIHDDDHVIALYRERGLWGGIAKSNFAGLRFRAPIYRTLRELALSYFEIYYTLRGERPLRNYSGPVDLRRLDGQGWMTSEEDVWCVPELLIAALTLSALFPDKVAQQWMRLDRRSFGSRNATAERNTDVRALKTRTPFANDALRG